MKWHFNLLFAPHFGGVFEILIKSIKWAVYDAGAEGLINSRPLTYQSACNVSPIIPNHFLFGQLGGQFAPEVQGRIYYGVMRKWKHVQLSVQCFWNRWMLNFQH